MKIVTTIKEVREQVAQWRAEGRTVGLVPTMGYLHEGHQSLMQHSVHDNDRTVVSDFVNPTQFGPDEDYESYPRDIQHDAKKCDEAGADLIFLPSVEEMYPGGFCSFVDMNGLTKGLCGASRPIHFRGVCTVVTKLFNIVQPDRAYFGQKDAQQLSVIRRMATDLNQNLKIIGVPIVREDDGLAKSSRNTYLTPELRAEAPVLNRALQKGKAAIEAGETSSEIVRQIITDEINTAPNADIEYVEIVDWNNLEPTPSTEGSILAAVAVRFGTTRLIDNFIIERD